MYSQISIPPLERYRSVPTQRLTSYQQAYYWTFVLSVILCLSPLKLVAYVTPFIALAIFVILTRSGLVLRNFTVWLCSWGLFTCLHFFFNPVFVWHSALLTLITYSTFAFAIAVPHRWLSGRLLLDRIFRFVVWALLIEAALGFVQAIYGFLQNGTFDRGNGDYVEGTISPALSASLSFSNPIFAANMSFLLITVAVMFLLHKKGWVPLLAGAIVLVLASVVHILLFLFAAITLTAVFYNQGRLPKRGSTLVIVATLVVVAAVALFLLRTNFGYMRNIYQNLVTGSYPRSRVVMHVIQDIPEEYPLMPLLGLGPGQFSSRAALIGTGLYFGGPLNPRPIPFLPQNMSAPLEDYLLVEWIRALTNPYTSSIKQPLFSWLSLYSEFGMLGVLLLLGFITTTLVRLKQKSVSHRQKLFAAAATTSILFLLFLGFQENYWEIPQSIFLGILLIKIFYANSVSAESVHESPTIDKYEY